MMAFLTVIKKLKKKKKKKHADVKCLLQLSGKARQKTKMILAECFS